MHRTIKYTSKIFIAAAAGLFIQQSAKAQDTLKEATIDIITNYQPKLRDAAKLNLTASLPATDSSRSKMNYNIPALNLNFMYQPVPLKPLALGKDSLNALQNNFIKVGYGNLSTPLIQAGVGSGRNDQYNLGLFFNYTGSKGDIQYQDYSTMNILGSGTYFAEKFEVDGRVGFNRNRVNYYGYDHTLIDLKEEDVKQVFSEVFAKVGLRNRPADPKGFKINPNVEFIAFKDSYKRQENTFVANIPVSKEIFDDIHVKVSGVFDLSAYKMDGGETINNNVSSVRPAVEITKPSFYLRVGVNPTWTNKETYILPDITNDIHIAEKKLILSSGWVNYINKNNFRNLANMNPFIADYPNTILNTKVQEIYTGIKGTLGSHFNYNTKIGVINYKNMPLFVNDATDPKKFAIRNEASLKATQIHGEIGYIDEEKFQVRLGATYFDYGKQETELKPYGLVPLNANLNIQYTIAKKLQLKADLFAFGGNYYVIQPNDFNKTDGAFDMNLGASYDITKNFGLWFNANNLFNSKYQRWNGYQSYGVNVLGGLMIKF
ncbi:hypothetical protein LX64_02242 [Chitinophaga skermanii]|uniref:Uncharacterized protein n=2 Tax=Chitinophaga skermanii TaxID=331697 RepID=A0A327QM36_9BACT|nr:hypothetical protein LX64_02242 [Chitinophaga skermanii]